MAHSELTDVLVRAVRSGAILVLAFALVSCSDWLGPRASPIEATASRVLQTTSRVATRLVTVRTELGTLVTTPDHLFAKVDAGWTPAADLAVGDRVHVRGSAEGTVVLELNVREAPPTLVYNLTVERTHTYFVGSQDLLVHNVNCLGWTRRKPGRSGRSPEAQARKRADLFLDVLPRGPIGTCTACTMAALGDFDTVSHFLDAHTDKQDANGRNNVFNSLRGLFDDELIGMMKVVGLRSDTTPDPATFPKLGTRLNKESKTRAERSPGARFKYWDDVEKFMQTSEANTFAVTVKYLRKDGHNAHALVGVRKDDGSLAFLDFSFEPPVLLDIKKMNIWSVTVIPTDVDWHDNRHVTDLFKHNPKRTPPPRHWR
jgi:hypothetical protein